LLELIKPVMEEALKNDSVVAKEFKKQFLPRN